MWPSRADLICLCARLRRAAVATFSLVVAYPAIASSAEGVSPPLAQNATSSTVPQSSSDIRNVPLEHLLDEDLSSGEAGGFGKQLNKYGISPYFHGALALEWRSGTRNWDQPQSIFIPSSFRLREAELYFGADIAELVTPEIYLQFEPPPPSQVPSGAISTIVTTVRYAQIDLKLHKTLAILRAGQFLVPFGVGNDALMPRFINKLTSQPSVVLQLPWSEVGVQLLGKWELAEGRSLSYAVYVSNGMVASSTGRLFTSYNSSQNQRSFGGRLGFQPIRGLTFNVSGYRGPYTHDALMRTIGGLGADFRRGPLSIDAEVIQSNEDQSTGDSTLKRGAYVVVAYKFFDMLEPVAAWAVNHNYSGLAARITWTQGVNVYPFPNKFRTLVTKFQVAESLTQFGTEYRGVIQMAIGF